MLTQCFICRLIFASGLSYNANHPSNYPGNPFHPIGATVICGLCHFRRRVFYCEDCIRKGRHYVQIYFTPATDQTICKCFFGVIYPLRMQTKRALRHPFCLFTKLRQLNWLRLRFWLKSWSNRLLINIFNPNSCNPK